MTVVLRDSCSWRRSILRVLCCFIMESNSASALPAKHLLVLRDEVKVPAVILPHWAKKVFDGCHYYGLNSKPGNTEMYYRYLGQKDLGAGELHVMEGTPDVSLSNLTLVATFSVCCGRVTDCVILRAGLGRVGGASMTVGLVAVVERSL